MMMIMTFPLIKRSEVFCSKSVNYNVCYIAKITSLLALQIHAHALFWIAIYGHFNRWFKWSVTSYGQTRAIIDR